MVRSNLESRSAEPQIQSGQPNCYQTVDFLEDLIQARYTRDKLAILESLNYSMETLRYQTRLLLDFELISAQRYEFASKSINEIGADLGGWIKQQNRCNQ